jgi:hypothetical protein
MRRIPITIKRLKMEGIDTFRQEGGFVKKEVTKFLLSIEEKGHDWSTSIICDRDNLLKLRDEINEVLASITTAETLGLSNEEGKVIDKHYENDPMCKECKYKHSFHCKTCLLILQSPLERKLYIELTNERISFQSQYGLDWKGIHISTEGKKHENPTNNFKNVLTVVDFIIEKRNQKLCIYTDGHTYHERTEEQATHDKNIDRKLQSLGFKVYRFTGKEINDNMEKTIKEIKDWIGSN